MMMSVKRPLPGICREGDESVPGLFIRGDGKEKNALHAGEPRSGPPRRSCSKEKRKSVSNAPRRGGMKREAYPSFSAAFVAANLARAVPQDPLPMQQIFSRRSPSPVNSSNLARNGARAGEDPLRDDGCFNEFLREIPPLPETEGRLAEGLAASFSSASLDMERFAMALRRGEGGLDEPGVETGETGREPGRDSRPAKFEGEVGRVGAGEARGVAAAERGAWKDSVEAVDTREGRSAAMVDSLDGEKKVGKRERSEGGRFEVELE